ncbi:MAG: amino acid adenylation domain-containing protein, partial [Acidimicrobiia bacterium]
MRIDPRPDHIPLSYAQQRMWLANQLDTSSPAYNVPVVLRLEGPLDIAALRAAIVDVVERHEVLRTTFPSRDGTAVQVVAPADEAADRLEWATIESGEQLAAELQTGFDVSEQFPFRVRLWEVEPDKHVLVLVAHHIAADGESMAPLVSDIVTAYFARAHGQAPEFSPLPVQIADFALWQRRVLGSVDDPDSEVSRQLDHWTKALAGLPDVLPLPTDRPRPVVASQAGAMWDFEVPETVADRIRLLERDADASAFMIVHAALAVLLARLSGTDDIAVGTPVAGRGQAELDPLVGMFVNTLVLRTRVDGDQTFADLLADVASVDLDAFSNTDVPFESVVEATGTARSAAYAPLTQVWLTFNQSAASELDGDLLAGADPGGLRVISERVEDIPARVDLLISVNTAVDGSWTGSILYATDLFDSASMDVFARRLVRILDVLTADPALPVGDVVLDAPRQAAAPAEQPPALPATASPAMSVEELGLALLELTDVITSGLPTPPRLLADLFTDAAAKHGPRQAVIDSSGAALTYAELNAQSNRLARWLIKRGVGVEDLVALAITRSATLLTAIWAVAKTGGGYVPIDPDYPPERVAAMIEDSGAGLGLANEPDHSLPERGFSWVALGDASIADEIAAQSADPITDEERRGRARIDNTAYVIFTSGSTGRPKGVAVTHSGLANFAAEEARRSSCDEYSRVLGFASPSFDASVLEYLLATVSGAALVYRPVSAIGGDELADYMRNQAVTHTFLTPTVLATLDPATLPVLRAVYVGGEAVPTALKDEWAPLRRIQNLYGPTETTIGVTIGAPMTVGDPVVLGGPIHGVGLLVLDNRLRPVPAGVEGELYVLGGALSRGYLDHPSMTAERFVASPVGPSGARMYRTGDVVKWTDRNGEVALEYSGRADDQVKLRGLRIELGEISAALTDHSAVKNAVVVGTRADGGIAESGESVISGLAGYVVTVADVDMADLREWLIDRLPEYMVPASIMTIDELPRTPVGKLDRAALPAPEAGSAATAYEAPDGPMEEALASIVSALLGMDRVSVTESFFALGGDSIMSIQLASAAKPLGVVLSPRQIFELKTIRAMAAFADAEGVALPELREPEGGPDGPAPLTPIMSWLHGLTDSIDDARDFSQSIVLRAPASLTADGLHKVLAAVVGVHPMLGATMTEADGQWSLHAGAVAAGDAVSIDETASASAMGAPGFDDEIVDAFRGAARRLDPRIGRNVAATLLRDDAGAGVIVLVINHLFVDAVSWRTLIEDAATAWAQTAAGQPVELRPEGTSVRAWAHALAERAADRTGEVDYWLDRSPERVTDLGVTLDPARDRDRTVAIVVHRAPTVVSEALVTTVPEAFGGAVTDPLVAALARSIRSWQRDRGIVDDQPVGILIEGHGRYEDVLAQGPEAASADLSRTVGWFTTIAPMRVDPAADAVHAVKAAKEERLSQPDNGIFFGLLRYGPAADTLGARPLPVVTVNYLGNVASRGDGGETADFLPIAGAPSLPGHVDGAMVAANPLVVNVNTVPTDDGRQLVAAFYYPEALFATDDIDDLARRWIAELEAIVGHLAVVGDPGLSPSDVVGVDLTQDDLDGLARRYPGAQVWPLTPLQRGFYFQSEFVDADSTDGIDVYVAHAVLTLDGDVDVDRLRAAAAGVLDRHEVLRSGYVHVANGVPVAVVPPRVEPRFTVVDLRGLPADEVADR